MDNNIKRTIILDNYENPYNKGLTNDKDYCIVNANNESCIDNFDLEIKVENNVIKDMHFDGEGCAISTSSTSIMLKLLIGKTIDEAIKIIEEYEKMIDEKEYDENILEEAIVYSDVYKQPSRKKCALLSYVNLKKYLLSLKKRIGARAVIFDGDKVYLMFRRKKGKEYYVLPGGGVENGESLADTVKRELKEEFSVDIKIIGYLGTDVNDPVINHFFHCEILNGTPILGGEELENNSEDNYYEIRELNINDIDNYTVYGKEMIIKALNKDYKDYV